MLFKWLEKLFFVIFLGLLITITLPFGSLDGFYWTSFGLASSVLLSLVLINKIVAGSGFTQAFIRALPFIGLMLLHACYVIFQSNMTGEVLVLRNDSIQPPNWFQPANKISFVPNNMIQWIGKYALSFIFLLLALLLFTSRLRMKIAIYTIIFCALLHGSIGFIASYYDVHLVPLQSIDGHYNISRGLFVNRNHFAVFVNYGLGMLMVGGFYYLYTRSSGNRSIRNFVVEVLDFVLSNKLIWLFILACLAISMNLSSSRAGVLGFVAAVSVTAFLVTIIDSRFRLSIKPLIAILVVFGLLVIFSSGESGIVTRLQNGGLDLGERYEQWAITLSIFKKHWLFGTGTGTYAEAFQFYRENDTLREVVYDQAHSHYLHTLMEQGVIGFSIWIAGIFLVLFTLLSNIKSQASLYIRSIILGVILVMLISLLQSFVDFNLMIPALSVYFYTFIALGYSAISIYSSESSSKEASSKPLSDSLSNPQSTKKPS